jgi:hypothetical protein
MPRQTNAQGQTLDNWRRLIKSLLANLGELPHLEAMCAKLAAMTDLALELVSEQRLLASRRQETSKKLQELLVEGRRIADFLQTGIRAHYGTRSEKLTEYGIQPFRGRKLAKPTEIVEAAAPSPAPASETPEAS